MLPEMMTALCRLIFWNAVDVSASNTGGRDLVLRQQIHVLRRAAPRKAVLCIFIVDICWPLSIVLQRLAMRLAIVKPDTIHPLHRAGFRAYWRLGSRNVVVADQVYPECAN